MCQGNMIQALREHAGLSRVEFAELVRFSKHTVESVELGRRMPDEDARQIKRWKAMRRHVRQLQRACESGDIRCRRRQRQALLHWAYDSRRL